MTYHALLADPSLTDPPSLLLRVDDVCGLLSLSRSTVNRLLVNGTIPSVAVGRTRRVVRVDLVAFVADLAAGSTSVAPRAAGRKPTAR